MKPSDNKTDERVESFHETEQKSPENLVVASPHDPYRAFRSRDFRLLFAGTLIMTIGEQMINVAIGWQIYEYTGSALALGLVGLVQVSPVLLFSLLAGHFADRFNRKMIVVVTQMLLALASLGLMILAYTHGALFLIYTCLFVIGLAAAFSSPATSTLLPQIVPEEAYGNAATWSSSSWQLASVLGPALGGFLIAWSHGTTLIYAFNVCAALLFLLLMSFLHMKPRIVEKSEETTIKSLTEGIRFLRHTRIILAAITLDMFAVLLGGATTLLPIFAKDILHVGATGLGWLRAAPSLGAISVSIGLAHIPPFKRAGRVLLWAVAGFGAATIIFGLSHSFWLSMLMLAFIGAFDNISVVIRSTLLLTRTPDALRGRVASVNSLFIGASNELGGFESGLAAQFFGPVIAVAAGGVGTMLVVLCVALIWPEMRRLGALYESKT